MTIDLLRTIIMTYMGLEDERINVWNQKFTYPTDDGMFIVISFLASKTYASIPQNVVNADGSVSETNIINSQERFSIEVFSRSLAAYQQKELVVQALYSNLSIQLQEANGFRIARIAPIQNLSMIEPTANMYRFEIPIVVLASYINTLPIPSFKGYNVFVDASNDAATDLTASFTQPTALPIT